MEELLGLLVCPVRVNDGREQGQPEKEQCPVGQVQAAGEGVPVTEAHPPHVVGEDHSTGWPSRTGSLTTQPVDKANPSVSMGKGKRHLCPSRAADAEQSTRLLASTGSPGLNSEGRIKPEPAPYLAGLPTLKAKLQSFLS